MTESKFHKEWFTLNDKAVIEEMRKDRNSEHWKTCNEYICYYVEKQFPNLLPELRQEATQESIVSVFKGLSGFRFDSKLITWLTNIARNRAIDAWRRQNSVTKEISMDDLPEGHESDIEKAVILKPRTPEEMLLAQEQEKELLALLEAFLQEHSKAERNREILRMAMFEGLKHEEIAEKLNINAPVVGHVVRSARRYLCEKLPYFAEKFPHLAKTKKSSN